MTGENGKTTKRRLGNYWSRHIHSKTRNGSEGTIMDAATRRMGAQQEIEKSEYAHKKEVSDNKKLPKEKKNYREERNTYRNER